jgi:hypothetical protein
MHDAETTGKTPHLSGEGVSAAGFPEQRLGGGAAFGTNCIG